MDAQSRGRADEIDPADQWVLNPETGSYELRLDHSTGSTGQHSPSAARPGTRRRDVPGQRTRPQTNSTPHPDSRSDSPEDGRGASRSGPRGGSRNGSRTGSASVSEGAQPSGGRRSRKAVNKPRKKKKILLWTGGVTAFVLVGGSVGAYLVYQHFNGNLETYDVAGAGTGGFKKDEAVNILVIGTDKRTGKGNEGYGDKDSVGHADTTILFHVSKDRTNATALSIPRDLITDIPVCPTKQPDGSIKDVPGTLKTKFNESLGQSGRDPGCTMRTVKEITGITVDHFMMADFNAVKTMSSAVGGVEVCLAKDINDKDSHLNLPAGKHNLKGDDALAYVRTRHSVGFGGDLSRIELQQQFLGSLIRKMKSSDTLSSPTKMWDLAEAATKALAVDKGIGSIEKLKNLGLELAEVDPSNITFATVPVVDNTDGATVLLNEEKAEQLFAMVRSDTSLTEVKAKEKAAKSAQASKQAALLKGPKADPSDVRVAVYNGSETVGAASKTLTWLQLEQGVTKSSSEGNAPQKQAKTTLTYGSDQADQARALAAMMGLPATALKPNAQPAAEREPMVLTLGGDFKGAGQPVTGPAKAPEGIQRVNADKSVCAK
ncbi:LCP family protein [Streptomyces sp. NPDC050504]|uniref:LCP family protein n=1 Tax=Streptomyces sp. NPDC050504 TaxID=3365618 RepID=UPI0037A355AB